MSGEEERRGDCLEGGVWPPHHRSAEALSGLVMSLVGQELAGEAGLTEKLEQENWS